MKKIALIAAVALAASCSSHMEAPLGSAMFDFFTYEGTDPMLEAVKLPGSDFGLNPVLQGWHPDPSICTNGEGDYYIVTSSSSYYPGIPVYHSKDLLNWESVGYVLERQSQVAGLLGQRVSEGIYAPDIKYNPSDKSYYMITTDMAHGIFFVKTDDPAGDWSNPVYIPELEGVDPSFFFDNDGSAYIVYNSNPAGPAEYSGHKAIWIARYDLQAQTVVGEPKVIVDKGARPEAKPTWTQGPRMFNVDGRYILICSEGASRKKHAEVAFSSDSPLGAFKPFEQNPILSQTGVTSADSTMAYPVYNAGHADMVKATDGKWWAVFTGSRPNEEGFDLIGRETFMLPVTWAENGCPVILPAGEAVPAAVKVDGAKRKDLLTTAKASYKDDFNGSSLDGRWMTLRESAEGIYGLVDQDYLKLPYSEVTASARSEVPALILTRTQHPEFEVTTRVAIAPESYLDKAGILLFKDETHQYFMSVSDGALDLIMVETVLQIEQGKQPMYVDDTHALAHKMLPKFEFMDIKVTCDGKSFAFWYAVDGKKWTLLASELDARFLSTAGAGGFTGMTIGLYATKL